MKKMSVLSIINLLADADTRISLKDFSYRRVHAASVQTEDALPFTPDGFARISDVTFCEGRAILSMLVSIEGTVALPADAPAALPATIRTTMGRNYTIVRDGQLNVASIPCKIGRGVHAALSLAGLVEDPYYPEEVYDIDLTGLPISKHDISNSEVFYFNSLALLEDNKAALKAAKFFLNKLPKAEPYFVAKYGTEAAEYLYGLGITENGYSPKTEKTQGTTPVDTRELVAKIKGYSVPSVNALLQKMEKGKELNAGEQLLKRYYDAFLRVFEKETAQSAADILKGVAATYEKSIRNVGHDMAEVRFSWLGDPRWLAAGQSLKMTMGMVDGDSRVDRECTLEVRSVREMV